MYIWAIHYMWPLFGKGAAMLQAQWSYSWSMTGFKPLVSSGVWNVYNVLVVSVGSIIIICSIWNYYPQPPDDEIQRGRNRLWTSCSAALQDMLQIKIVGSEFFWRKYEVDDIFFVYLKSPYQGLLLSNCRYRMIYYERYDKKLQSKLGDLTRHPFQSLLHHK